MTALRCCFCGRPIANHGLMDRLTYVGDQPFHYQCTLPPSPPQPFSPYSPAPGLPNWVSPHGKPPGNANIPLGSS